MSKLLQGRKPITDEELAALTRRLVGTVIDYKELYEAAVRDAKEAEAYAEELEKCRAAILKERDELLRHLKMAQLWLDVDGRFDMQGINAAIAKCEAKP